MLRQMAAEDAPEAAAAELKAKAERHENEVQYTYITYRPHLPREFTQPRAQPFCHSCTWVGIRDWVPGCVNPAS